RFYAAAGSEEVGVLDAASGPRYWSRAAEWPTSDESPRHVIVKIAVPPSELTVVVHAAESTLTDIDTLPAIGGRAASGVLYVRLTLPAALAHRHLALGATQLRELRHR